MITKTDTDSDTLSPPAYEEAWAQSLNNLQQQMVVYETAQRIGDEKIMEQEAPKVADAMRHVGDSQTDPKVKAVWYKKADNFLRSNKSDRHGILREVGKVAVGVITFPFAMTCCMISATGSAIRGVGEFVSGSGKDHPKQKK